MLQASSHVLVSGQLTRVTGTWCGELWNALAYQFAQPNVAKIHQFGVLDISKVRRISHYRVKAFRRPIGLGCIGAGQLNLSHRVGLESAVRFANPLTRYLYRDLSAPAMQNFERLGTVGLGLGELGRDIGPTSASDAISIACASYTKKIGFALNETDREAVHRENIE
jgi:hypothetical protein